MLRSVQQFKFALQNVRSYSNNKLIVKPIDKLLIANRGEIACRIMRTTNRLGIKSVAVYSEPDRSQIHVKQADEAHCIGPAASQLSYLNMHKILEVAKETGCQAIHPGYGFLSENVEFGTLCANEGIIFVGPPSSAIRDMGIKSTSKKIMQAANVPVIEGYHGDDQSDSKLIKEAKQLGFPVMLKAVRGGGGKGMRIAMKESEFFPQLEAARRESMASFGDDVMLIEKYIERPRHVEVQVFGDHHGNAVHLYERDCSVQRRHQKIIEEAPAPHISTETRNKLGLAAVRAARAVGYVGAGTVEFVMDVNHNFYFMEMNTRLQVEHPITEMVTDTDLVEWQLMVAQGEKIPKKQSEISLSGHSFEARIYAEDPDNNFMPGAGPLIHLKTPIDDANVRVETGVRQGDQVSPHYDPMIAKLVVWAEDRSKALTKLDTCLSKYEIVGPDTNIQFLRQLATHKRFIDGEVHTGFIPQHFDSLFPAKKLPDAKEKSLLTCLYLLAEKHIIRSNHEEYNDWGFNVSTNFCMNFNPQKEVSFIVDGNLITTKVTSIPGNKLDGSEKFVVTSKNEFNEDITTETSGSIYLDSSRSGEIITSVNGVVMSHRMIFTHGNRKKRESDRLIVYTEALSGNGRVVLNIPLNKYLVSSLIDGESKSKGSNSMKAPMTGNVEKVFVREGEHVKEGQTLMVMIAMKMEHQIKSPRDGVIERVFFSETDSAERNQVLIKLNDD